MYVVIYTRTYRNICMVICISLCMNTNMYVYIYIYVCGKPTLMNSPLYEHNKTFEYESCT